MKPTITYTTIQAGPAGTKETLIVMRSLVARAAQSPVFRDFAKMFRTAQEVDETIRPYYDYTPEDVETLYAPEYNLANFINTARFIGDCDDIAMLYAAIFTVLRLPTRLVAMKTLKGDPQYDHVVVEVFEHGRWKRFDATVIPGLTQTDYGQMVEYI